MYLTGKVPCGSSTDPFANIAPPGFGCVDCNGGCSGLGLFEGFNVGNFGWREWLAAAGAAYTIYSLAFTTRSGATRVRRAVGRRKRSRAIARRLA